ncbi:hypothetical protein ACJMK2_000990 [Sinanodonta woodiana]|uniref:Ribosome assembly factor mrt4 n=1 Tax=Sinanodonta woodiana TaxID=1069815 RepID=A0ABD3XUB0_SINWO
MPKSKRNKKISLTQTRKKGLELKQKIIEEIRECIDSYARIFLFSVQNMRNTYLKDVRCEWKHSRFFFGKNKVMSLALGRTAQDEYRDNLHQISSHLRGQTGILFTNKTKKEVVEYFKNFRKQDYARSGNTATQTVVLEEGLIPQFSHSMEPQLRQLGLPTALKKGVIALTKEYTVCEQGSVLTPEMARLLKLFGHKMADFHVTVEAMWSNDGTWEEFCDTEEKITPSKVKVKAKAREDNSLIESAEIEMSDEEEEEDEEEFSEETDDDCG